jgi:hypothetical protein
MTDSEKLEIGKHYDRKKISKMLGGNYRCALPYKDGEVTAGCYDPIMNPKAPKEVLVGKGRDKEKYSRKIADDRSTIPIFLKRGSKKYEFVGYYQATKYSDNKEEIEEKNNSNRSTKEIAAVLYYEEVETV